MTALHAISPRHQWTALEWASERHIPTVPTLYGGMLGKAHEGFPNLARELDRIPHHADLVFVDWERQTLRNQQPLTYYAAKLMGVVDAKVAEWQYELLRKCRGMRRDVKAWGVYNFPRCFYRTDGQQPPVDSAVLGMTDVFAPSWYGLPTGQIGNSDTTYNGEANRYSSLYRGNRLDPTRNAYPWVKPSDPRPEIRHVVWHEIHAPAQLDAWKRRMTFAYGVAA